MFVFKEDYSFVLENCNVVWYRVPESVTLHRGTIFVNAMHFNSFVYTCVVSYPQSLVWDGLITSRPVKIVDSVAIMQTEGIIECGRPK